MFDFAWSELALIAAVSVLVLGPKQLPETMRTMAKVLRKVRGLSAEFQGHFNEMVREAELEELRSQVQKLSTASLSDHVTKMIDPAGEISGQLQAPLMDPHAATEAAQASVMDVAPLPAVDQPAVEPPAIEAPPVVEGVPHAPQEPAASMPPRAPHEAGPT